MLTRLLRKQRSSLNTGCEYLQTAQKCDQIARAQDADIPDKLRMLFAYTSADVYELIEDCADYETALSKLKSLCKSPECDFCEACFGSAAPMVKHRDFSKVLPDFVNFTKFCQMVNFLTKFCLFWRNFVKLPIKLNSNKFSH